MHPTCCSGRFSIGPTPARRGAPPWRSRHHNENRTHRIGRVTNVDPGSPAMQTKVGAAQPDSHGNEANRPCAHAHEAEWCALRRRGSRFGWRW